MPVFRCTSCGRLLFRPGNLLGRAWQCPSCGPTEVSENSVSVNAELAGLLEREYDLSASDSPDVSAVQCASCKRVLYRPVGLLGRAWQCPNCGPTVVSAGPGRSLAWRVRTAAPKLVVRPRSQDISTTRAEDRGGEGPPIPFWPPRPSLPTGGRRSGQQELTVPTTPRVLGVALYVLAAMILVVIALACAGVMWRSWGEYIVPLVVVVLIGAPILALIAAVVVTIRGDILRNRKVNAVDSQLQTAPPPKLDWPAPPAPTDADGRVQRGNDSVSPPAERD
jgi:predicted RNA-binding Zn-ribbon protein involved in translation (DUF1610 family)